MARADDAAFELSLLLLSGNGAERKSRWMIAQDAPGKDRPAVADQADPSSTSTRTRTRFTPAGVFARKFFLDRGPQFDVNDIAGVMAEPPAVGGAYSTLVPKIDENGNTADGLRNTTVRVPLGTYMGSNVRRAGFSEGDSCDLTGSFIPFFKTQSERVAAGDPRPSLAERYPTHADYVQQVTAAATTLVGQRLLLPADATQLIEQANAAAVP
jgi:hypothetical protein